MSDSSMSFINKWANLTPNAIALVNENEKITYSLLAALIAKFIKAFDDIGITKGMFIGLSSDAYNERTLELVMALALDALGAIRVSKLEDEEVIKRCSFILCITGYPSSQSSSKIIDVTNEWTRKVLNDTISDKYIERLNCQPDPGQPLFLGSTSGTTGEKKYYLVEASIRERGLSFLEPLWLQKDIHNYLAIWTGLDHFWPSYFSCYLTLTKGGSIIFSGLHRFFDDASTYPNSFSGMILKDVHYLMKNYPEVHGGTKISSFRVFGSHLPVDARTWLRNNVAKRVFNSYSSSESGQIAEKLNNGDCRLYPGVKVRIVKDDWGDVGFGVSGRIAIKSPIQISGYLWRSQLNQECFKDGWFLSNDIGYLTPENNLILLDRVDNMVNLGGNKVVPKPIEDAIKLISDVDDCVLIEDISCSKEDVVAICIETSKNLDKDLLDDVVTSFFPNKNVSYRFCFMQNFPRTDTGKVKRKIIQKMILSYPNLNYT